MKIEVKVTDEVGNIRQYPVSGCFVQSNDFRPEKEGHYFVIHTDHNHGAEYFDGTHWQVGYSHPVEYWLLVK